MGMTAPSREAQEAAALRLKTAREKALPLTNTEVAALEDDWSRDGMHHHMGATSTVHRLLATIANLKA